MRGCILKPTMRCITHLTRPLLIHQCIKRNISSEYDVVQTVFDRELKRKQLDRAAMMHNSADYDYLRDEVAGRLADRLNV
jgi:hypothetical protein